MNIPEAAVEAAARALYEQAVNASMSPDVWPEWGADGNRETRNAFTEDADAALAAAAPYIAAQVASDIHGQFGVNVSDEMSDWWDGYRQAQRDVLRKLREIEAYYRIEADHG